MFRLGFHHYSSILKKIINGYIKCYTLIYTFRMIRFVSLLFYTVYCIFFQSSGNSLYLRTNNVNFMYFTQWISSFEMFDHKLSDTK